MEGCSSLETLPNGINLQSLDRLHLSGCSRLNRFPDISTNISVLLTRKTSIQELPSNMYLMKNLVYLWMGSGKCWKRVQPLTPLMAMLPHTLEELFLSDIPTLVELPSSIKSFKNLYSLTVIDCINLETLPTGINFPDLHTVDLSGCPRLKIFPDISTNIRDLYLARTGITEVPWWIEKFTKLLYLDMKKCNNLVSVSLNIYKLNAFIADFSDCVSLTESSWNGSPSDVAMATDKFHPKCPVLDEAFYSDPPKLLFQFRFLNLDPEVLLNDRSIVCNDMTFSGEEIPSYFTHQTTELSFTNVPLPQTYLSQQFFKFKACALVIFDSLPRTLTYPVCIRVNCQFKDRFGNSFDTFGRPYSFITNEKDNLFILDCRVPLNKDSAPLSLHNYDHVDLQIHIRKILMDLSYLDEYTFTLKGWGIRLLEECSFPEKRLGNPNTISFGIETIEDNNLVIKTEHSGECVDTVVKRPRETKSEGRLCEGPLKKPLLRPASDTQEEQSMSL